MGCKLFSLVVDFFLLGVCFSCLLLKVVMHYLVVITYTIFVFSSSQSYSEHKDFLLATKEQPYITTFLLALNSQVNSSMCCCIFSLDRWCLTVEYFLSRSVLFSWISLLWFGSREILAFDYFLQSHGCVALNVFLQSIGSRTANGVWSSLSVT